jgi:hypothetical protein
MKKIFLLIVMCALSACSSTTKTTEAPPDAEVSTNDKKIYIETEDIILDGNNATLPIQVRCISGKESVVIQIGDSYKAFKCGIGTVNYNYKFPVSELKKKRDKKKDYIVRIRSFHGDDKDKTLSQALVIVSYKDYQTKLVINQNVLTIEGMDGMFSDLSAHGQCVQGSTVDVEVYDDWRGVSLEEESMPCGETGFAYFSRKPGAVKKGMRLLIRQKKGKRAIASYEVVLFN